MQQVKIFKAVDTELAELELEINRWIQKYRPKIVSITGNLASQAGSAGGPMSSFAAGDVVIIVLYEVVKKPKQIPA